MSIYTKKGDAGTTSLVGGVRVEKSDLRVDCYGTIDELNAAVSFACKLVQDQDNTCIFQANFWSKKSGPKITAIQYETSKYENSE